MNKVLGTIGKSTIIQRNTKFEPFICASGYDEKTGTWNGANYFDTFQDACISALARLEEETPVNINMQNLAHNYEVALTAEFLRENYDVSDEDAWSWASDVREKMDEDEDYISVEGQYIDETKGEYLSLPF